MIDIHCHILPGMDDGAQKLEDSLAMAKKAVSDGITHILVTPHYKNGVYVNPKESILDRTKFLQQKLFENNIPLKLLPGQEVRLNGDLISDIEKKEIQFIDKDNQYLLIELPTASVPYYTEKLFLELGKMNVIPVIAHPERNQDFINNPDKLYDFILNGAFAQLTAGSYLGLFGKKIQKVSREFIKCNLVHFIASDAHNVSKRTFNMTEAYEKLNHEFGESVADYFEQNAIDLVNGNMYQSVEPEKVVRKKFLGIF